MSKFILEQTKTGKYRFYLKAPNGQVIAMSQNYASKSGAVHGIEMVRKYSFNSPIEDQTDD
jgi:uncharacterized protein YegP (UPF0339 family)